MRINSLTKTAKKAQTTLSSSVLRYYTQLYKYRRVKSDERICQSKDLRHLKFETTAKKLR